MPVSKCAVVLVVEDEPLIRLAAVDTLEASGYTVIQAGNADQAIQLLSAHPEITILFTDVEMPGQRNGIDLAIYVRDRWPPVEIIVTSGRVLADDIALPARGVFLAKPYRDRELSDHLALMAK